MRPHFAEMRVDWLLAFFIFCEYFALHLATTVTPNFKSGPFKTILTRVKKCDKPSAPYLKDPIYTAFIEKNDNDKNHIKGNLTILRDSSNIKVNVQEFYSEGGKWQMTFNMKNLSCHSHFISELLDSMAIIYDKKSCAVPKGTYDFDADFDQLDHIWMATREYGRMLRRVEATSGRGSAGCLELEIDVKPA